jgi:hypothetical protein
MVLNAAYGAILSASYAAALCCGQREIELGSSKMAVRKPARETTDTSCTAPYQTRFQIVVQGPDAGGRAAALGNLEAAEQNLLPWGPVTVLTGVAPNGASLLDLLVSLHRAGILLLAVRPLDDAPPPGLSPAAKAMHPHTQTAPL